MPRSPQLTRPYHDGVPLVILLLEILSAFFLMNGENQSLTQQSVSSMRQVKLFHAYFSALSEPNGCTFQEVQSEKISICDSGRIIRIGVWP